ncbi:MAG: DUF4058 family protein [Gemmataceae bacterium]|nr:DUF4058 family protein [Gemmataceae bacterium]
MPSPFPGMDPYLEDPELFPDLHDKLIAHIGEALMARLPPPYYAVTGSRIWVEPVRRRVGPDVRIHRKNGGLVRATAASNGGTAVLTEPVIVTVRHDEVRETFAEIYTGRGKKRRLVTSIEILSPTNKTPGEQGRDLYRQKQAELAASKVNLVEIDLLRGGEHTTAVPREELIDQAGACAYHVCCWRFHRFQEYRVYPIQLDEPLPVLAIPLLPGDPDVPLPLQPLFDQVYDAGPYPRVVDYRDDVPPPPLPAEKRRWLKRRLSEAGVLAKK